MTRFQDNQHQLQPPSTVLAAKIFHSMRPLIEAAIGLMPQGTRPRKLMNELVVTEHHLEAGPHAPIFKNSTPSSTQSKRLSRQQKAFEKKGFDELALPAENQRQGSLSGGLSPALSKTEIKAKRGRPPGIKARVSKTAELGLKRGRKPGRYTIGEESLTLAEWVTKTGLSYATLLKRLREGTPLDAPKAKVGRKPNDKLTFGVNFKRQPLDPQASGGEGRGFEFHETDPLTDFTESNESSKNKSVVGIGATRGRPVKYPPITWQGETKSIKAWAEATGISVATIMARIGRGWSPETTLSMAPLKRGRRGPKKIKPVLNSRNFFAPIKQEISSKPKVILRKKIENGIEELT